MECLTGKYQIEYCRLRGFHACQAAPQPAFIFGDCQMKRLNIQIGDKFGRWTVVEEPQKRGVYRYFLCRCKCGKTALVRLNSLRQGLSKSCGCLHKELSRTRATKHGYRNTRLYRIWSGMRQRCENPKCEAYKFYGGRGISVCNEWNSIHAFIKWAKTHGYKKELTIERIDNNGNYEPSNCTWIPMAEQAHNRRSSHIITYKGRSQILTDWAKEYRIGRRTLFYRLKAGWSIRNALTAPLKGTKQHVH